jgi:hypothetical protein
LEERSSELAFKQLGQATEPVSAARELWSAVSVLHNDMNILARNDARQTLSPTHLALMNEVLEQVIELLNENGNFENLQTFNLQTATRAGDALFLLGHFKGCLRNYRIAVLEENGFSF